MAERTINIINSTEYQKLIKKLNKEKMYINTWDSFSIEENNDTINIFGTVLKVQFLDSKDGGWFKIKRFDDQTVYLENFINFGMMRNC